MSTPAVKPARLFAKLWWRDTLTGKEGVYDESLTDCTVGSVWLDEETGEPDWFMWEDGNYGCDCNRSLFFLGVDLDECLPCGDGRFEILKREVVAK